ncbi:hypothetical protein KC19_8G014200 [Ceratodon purpureus]|uniref:Uncharacterized protein n=1 Tax=Ceratodon purpureus TaxID=3225 RepID=A0A8T0H294_CERPU|nr:hypothetical protein KC19_8G014200 [Ceratodon purpureus]KAG0563233.1 hypothetical protein KC19_8G014200 [Ceratodon purpureus]
MEILNYSHNFKPQETKTFYAIHGKYVISLLINYICINQHVVKMSYLSFKITNITKNMTCFLIMNFFILKNIIVYWNQHILHTRWLNNDGCYNFI